MRIVAGKHRGRRLEVPAGMDVRPTTDRTREAIFSMLQSGRFAGESGGDRVAGAVVADVFAGSGALGLEALSRGAALAVFVDNGQPALRALQANIAMLGEAASCRVIRADARRLPTAPQACDLVFLDPPYGRGLLEPALQSLANAGWLTADALLVCEAESGLDAPEGYSVLDRRTYGRSAITLMIRSV